MNIEQLHQIFLLHPIATTDSRNCPENSIFFALKGASFDGNEYAVSALEKGCSFAVVDNPTYATDPRCILVADVLGTLQQLAAFHRKHWGKTILQITGTNGKTTTKELVSAVLSRSKNILWTEGNLNNHIGVPRTLLRLSEEHEMAVVETGANHPGEIEFLCKMVQADCGLITNVGCAHLEGFGSFEGVKKTKGELYDDLKARQGFAFLNATDSHLSQMAGERGLSTIPYVQGRVLSCNPFLLMEWIDRDGLAHPVQTHLVGAYNLPNLLAAATVGLHFGVPATEIDQALAAYEPTNHRSEFRRTEHNSLLIDAYNANPTSMAAALANFALIEAPRKMAILGDMKELGEESLSEHRKIVNLLLQSDVEEVWLVGSEFAQVCQPLLSESGKKVECHTFPTVEEVKQALAAQPLSDRTILIKGSNSTRLYLLPELL